ncbi:MAG: GGDEF domain-containing protein [Nitrospinae bacterium]|nr:GGDEF domain-containing protein [Nitrospinota bacterium]
MEQSDRVKVDLATDIARKAIPFMAEKGIPVTPVNYFIWYEFFLGENQDLVRALKNLIASGAKFSDRVNQQIYEKHVVMGLSAEQEKKLAEEIKAVEEANLATSKILDPIAKDLKKIAETNADYGAKLGEFAGKMEDKADYQQVSNIIVNLLDDTRKIAGANKNISAQLDSYSMQINDLRQSLARARAEARLDDLTQVGNRRAYNEALEEEIKWVERNGAISCLAMVDLDFFKKLNDKYGHAVGDKALRALASILVDMVGIDGEVYRYGGEEFAIVVSGAKLEQALAIVEKARLAVEEHEFIVRDKVEKMTVSCGLATLRPGRAGEQSQLMADEALYMAKDNGRNNVKTELNLAGPGKK